MKRNERIEIAYYKLLYRQTYKGCQSATLSRPTQVSVVSFPHLYASHLSSISLMGKLTEIRDTLRATIRGTPINRELIVCYDCWHLVERGTRCNHCGCQN